MQPQLNWSRGQLVLYCYDHRPKLYARFTADTTREDILAWLGLGATPPGSTTVNNQAEKIQGQFNNSQVTDNTFHFS